MNLAVTVVIQTILAAGLSAPGPEVPEAVRGAARQRIEDGYYPSIVIGFIDATGSTIFAHGSTHRSERKKVDGKSLYEIGSISKAFTGVLLALAVEKGEVSLDDPIEKFLPEGAVVPRRGDRSITLLDLATQSSALPRLPDNFSPEQVDNPYADYTVEELYAFLASHELRRDIGSKYEYSNLGFGLLGHLLARRAEVDYEELVKSRITRVLGMKDTTITVTGELAGRWARGYDGALEATNWDLPTLAGAGAIRSTAHDMLTFVGANLGLVESPLLSAMGMSHEARRDAGSTVMKIGLGWHIRQTDHRKIVWHNGGTGGYRTFCGFVPEEKRGIVVLTNSTLGADDLGFHALDSSLVLSDAFPAVTRVDPSTLASYEGYYQLDPGPVMDLRVKNGLLTVQPSGQIRFTLYATSASEFRLIAPEATCALEKDDSGKITSLVWTQGGVARPGRKLGPDYTPPGPRKEIEVDAKILEQYVGKYDLAGLAVFDVTLKDGELYVQLTGQPRLKVFAESETRFFYKVVDAQITFEKDAAGKVEALVLHQSGMDQRAPRKP